VVPAEACRDAGYLCTGILERDEPRVLRWNSATGTIRVHVPPPPVEPRELARSLQDAAAAGVLAWRDKPFPLRVERSGNEAEAEIVVEWVGRLGGTELGRAETRWSRGADGGMEMGVTRFLLAFNDPMDPRRPLGPREVQLTAAHEMGHALGLPHSDSERDVMYPVNTATTLSPRDYRTMAALYALPNGAVVEPGAAGAGR